MGDDRHIRQAARAEAFRIRLIRGGVARPEDIVGCAPAEIAALEARFGRFPDSYRAVLGLMGRRAGNFIRHNEFWIFADQLDHINHEGRDCVATWAGDGVVLDVPPAAFFISARYGADAPHFLLTGDAEDSPVWAIDSDNGAVARACPSVWAWIAGYLIDHGLPHGPDDR